MQNKNNTFRKSTAKRTCTDEEKQKLKELKIWYTERVNANKDSYQEKRAKILEEVSEISKLIKKLNSELDTLDQDHKSELNILYNNYIKTKATILSK